MLIVCKDMSREDYDIMAHVEEEANHLPTPPAQYGPVHGCFRQRQLSRRLRRIPKGELYKKLYGIQCFTIKETTESKFEFQQLQHGTDDTIPQATWPLKRLVDYAIHPCSRYHESVTTPGNDNRVHLSGNGIILQERSMKRNTSRWTDYLRGARSCG
jgi:hypothetical protein